MNVTINNDPTPKDQTETLLTTNHLPQIIDMLKDNQQELFNSYMIENNIFELLTNKIIFDFSHLIDVQLDGSRISMIGSIVRAIDNKYDPILKSQIKKITQLSLKNAIQEIAYRKLQLKHRVLAKNVRIAREKRLKLENSQTAINKKIKVVNERLETTADVINIIRKQIWVKKR